METISIQRISTIHPKARAAALAAYKEAVQKTPVGVHPYITETTRSFQRSDELYKLGRTVVNPDGKSKEKPMGNIVSYAKGGESLHNYSLALDFVNQINGIAKYPKDPKNDVNWMIVVNIFKKHGFAAGIDWSGKKCDPPHFEMRFGKTTSQLLALKKAGKVDKDGYIIF